MCILFIYRNPTATGSAYRLIVATNRDEDCRRPTKPAHYWETHSDCLGGTDEEPGKEGGTWLALSKRGRAGVLLNLSTIPDDNAKEAPSDTPKKGRGFLVTNFVSSNDTASEYLKGLHEENQKYQSYNPYTLVLLDLKTANVSFLSSCTTCTGPVSSVHDQILGFGNTVVEHPYKKVEAGKEKFKKIVTANTADESELIEKLIQFLKSKEKHLPDDVLMAIHPEYYKVLSSIFIFGKEQNYVTRTHSIILVDGSNRVTFIEETLNDDKTWSRQRFDVSLD